MQSLKRKEFLDSSGMVIQMTPGEFGKRIRTRGEKKTSEPKKKPGSTEIRKRINARIEPDTQAPIHVGDKRQYEIVLLDDTGQRISLSTLPRDFSPTLERVSVNPSYATITSVDRKNLKFKLQCRRSIRTPVNILLSPGKMADNYRDFPSDFTVFIDQREKEPKKHICVRFFIVEECGGRNKDGKEKEGLLTGTKYKNKDKDNFGELSNDAVTSIKNVTGKASKIWEQCDIQIVPDSRDGKPSFYAFDPKDFPAEYNELLLIPGIGTVEATHEIDLCQFYEDREIEVDNGSNKPKQQLWRKLKWKKGSGGKEGDEIKKDELIEICRDRIGKIDERISEIANEDEIARLRKRKDELNKVIEQLEKTEREIEKLSVLGTFGDAVDGKFGEECLNVFVFKEVKNSGSSNEEGIAELGGRVIFLDESVVTSGKGGNILAHEIGHNLGLDHHLNSENVMSRPIKGGELDDTQCKKARDHLEKNTNKLAGKRKSKVPRTNEK